MRLLELQVCILVLFIDMLEDAKMMGTSFILRLFLSELIVLQAVWTQQLLRFNMR